jgi:hypothetical protein
VQGTVGNWEELGRATAIAERAKGVKEIEMLVEVDPGLLVTRRRARG